MLQANIIVAILHLFEYNKYIIFAILLEPLAKKVCSISFVSQYIKEFFFHQVTQLVAFPRDITEPIRTDKGIWW